MARLLQQSLQVQLKTIGVLDTRPGAKGGIAASQLKRHVADGSVILIAPNMHQQDCVLVYRAEQCAP